MEDLRMKRTIYTRCWAAPLMLLLLIPFFSLAAHAAVVDYTVQCWQMQEISFIAGTSYADPFDDIELDVNFTGPEGIVMAMPAFWDGDDTWRVRFAPTEVGLWDYETVCSNPADAGLHGVRGTIECVPYTGDLEVYRRGFIKTKPGVRYFEYADGTPFFYLGDTHWGMPKEPFDTMFKTVVDTRVQQGFTVYQSQPHLHPDNHGPGYNLRDGLQASDLAAFVDLDRRFAYIADAGLVHANAQLFFPTELSENHYEADYLRQLGRYWVARYGAYPVLWTTAQEADDDYYYERGDSNFIAEDNPWKTVAAAVGANDPYRHPLTAHQEATSYTNASKSEFKKLEAHTWFGVQWSPALDRSPDFAVPKDYWHNGGGKPAINYEGLYDYFWTGHFGARAQGWISYLNGMYGYGYGAIDLWLYQCTWDMDATRFDGVEYITPEDKATPWTESLYFETADQLGHMQRFWEEIEWWKFTPCFDDRCRFIPGWSPWWRPWKATATSFSVASDGNNAYVAYFYQPTRSTGLLRGLNCGSYKAEWFNPRTGEAVPIGTVRPFLGLYRIPSKPDKEDWVFYLFQNG
jgi:hypothetical protein